MCRGCPSGGSSGMVETSVSTRVPPPNSQDSSSDRQLPPSDRDCPPVDSLRRLRRHQVIAEPSGSGHVGTGDSPLTSRRDGPREDPNSEVDDARSACCWRSRPSAPAGPNGWSPSSSPPVTDGRVRVRGRLRPRRPDALAPDRSGRTASRSTRSGRPRNLDLRWMAAFRRLLLDGDFDIVHFHLPYTAALGRLVVGSLPRAVGVRSPSTPSTACGTRCRRWSRCSTGRPSVVTAP